MSLFDFFRSPSTDSAKQEIWQFLHWQVQTIRSHRRRTVSIELRSHQPILVRTNKRMTRKEIEKLLLQKRDWLEKNLKKLNQLPKLKPLELKNGEKLFYLGKKLPIFRSVTMLKSAFLVVDGDHIKLLLPLMMLNEKLPDLMVQQLLKQFYMREARKTLPMLFQGAVERTGLKPQKLRVGYMRTRWGSCSSIGRISLNSKIMAAPEWVIESVIIHELCHLKHMNHSQAYWRLADSLFPKHAEADLWLHNHM